MNIFSVLALRDEKYHNRMLVWLLDPQESHELGSAFLSDFLSLMGINHNPEEFVQIKAEYTIHGPDNLKTRRPDIYLQTDGHHIFLENKVRRSSINDEELIDQADYIRSQGYNSFIHVFIVPSLRDIPASTRSILKQNGIKELQWSVLTKILDEYIQTKETPDDIQVVLGQYNTYLKEHVMQELKGSDIVEIMQQYVDYTIYKYQNVEKKARRLIEEFLMIVGEEIQNRITGQEDWETWVENFNSNSINLGLYLARPKYRDLAFFGVWLYYFPEEFDDRKLHTAITLEVEARLVNTIRQHFEEFKARNHTEHDWGENQFDKENFLEFYEDWQLEWAQIEDWQNTKNHLVERTIEWMLEFTPMLEEQIIE